jgi:hypothetical protein
MLIRSNTNAPLDSNRWAMTVVDDQWANAMTAMPEPALQDQPAKPADGALQGGQAAQPEVLPVPQSVDDSSSGDASADDSE